MAVRAIPATEALAQLSQFDTVIDARTPAEFALDHLPRAENWPSLSDDERRVVGTDFKQVGGFEAKRLGAAMVARNVAAHIEQQLPSKPPAWKPLVYCWRGGKRSGTLAWFLDQIGYKTTLVEGGYKAFRAALVADLAQLPTRFAYQVLCGKTGSGKSKLLRALAAQGAQVLDLEALACHRGSVLGHLPGVPQPSQKAFDTAVWKSLSAMSPERPVWVEAESKKVGNVQVHEALIAHMRSHGKCFDLQLPDTERTTLLLEEYAFFVSDPAYFCQRLEALVPLCGQSQVSAWQTAAMQGQPSATGAVFLELMHHHYDPQYLKSIDRNFAHIAQAQPVPVANASTECYDLLAAHLMANFI